MQAYNNDMKKKKSTLKKFYAYFYDTGMIRKIMARDLEQAYKEAELVLGPSSGKYTIGNLYRGSVPQNSVPIQRS